MTGPGSATCLQDGWGRENPTQTAPGEALTTRHRTGVQFPPSPPLTKAPPLAGPLLFPPLLFPPLPFPRPLWRAAAGGATMLAKENARAPTAARCASAPDRPRRRSRGSREMKAMVVFADRREAGRQLARRLEHWRGQTSSSSDCPAAASRRGTRSPRPGCSPGRHRRAQAGRALPAGARHGRGRRGRGHDGQPRGRAGPARQRGRARRPWPTRARRLEERVAPVPPSAASGSPWTAGRCDRRRRHRHRLDGARRLRSGAGPGAALVVLAVPVAPPDGPEHWPRSTSSCACRRRAGSAPSGCSTTTSARPPTTRSQRCSTRAAAAPREGRGPPARPEHADEDVGIPVAGARSGRPPDRPGGGERGGALRPRQRQQPAQPAQPLRRLGAAGGGPGHAPVRPAHPSRRGPTAAPSSTSTCLRTGWRPSPPGWAPVPTPAPAPWATSVPAPGAGAALLAAADPACPVAAVVSRGGRVDLAAPRLGGSGHRR